MKPKNVFIILMSLCSYIIFGETLLAEEHVITQKNKAFNRQEIHILVGDTIAFKNDDISVHNIYTKSPILTFDTGSQQPGGSFTIGFSSAGKVKVRCAIHPKMKLLVYIYD